MFIYLKDVFFVMGLKRFIAKGKVRKRKKTGVRDFGALQVGSAFARQPEVYASTNQHDIQEALRAELRYYKALREKEKRARRKKNLEDLYSIRGSLVRAIERRTRIFKRLQELKKKGK